MLNSNVKLLTKKIFKINNDEPSKFDVVISSSSNLIMDNVFGALPYVGILQYSYANGICFTKDIYFVYYPNSEKFTKLLNIKNLLTTNSTSLIGFEIPSQ